MSTCVFTGRFAASYDSITLHWVTNNRDISQITYDDTLLKMVGLERDKLPDLKRAIDVLGPVKKEGGTGTRNQGGRTGYHGLPRCPRCRHRFGGRTRL